MGFTSSISTVEKDCAQVTSVERGAEKVFDGAKRELKSEVAKQEGRGSDLQRQDVPKLA